MLLINPIYASASALFGVVLGVKLVKGILDPPAQNKIALYVILKSK